MSVTRFAGQFRAWNFAYGVNVDVRPLVVDVGTTATGAGTLTLAFGAVVTSDGINFTPLNTNAPITVGSTPGSNLETVTPSAVSNGTPNVYNSATVTATFTYTHGQGESVSSGSVGLQEALNAASAYGGGTVIIDAKWVAGGGTQAMIDAATVPAGVSIVDNRAGAEGTVQTATVTLTNTQTLGMEATPVLVIPAPGSGYYIDVIDGTLLNNNTGTAYANGGAIQLSYGTALTYPATATVAATFLTGPTVAQAIKLTGALASTPLSDVAGKAIYISNATAPFITGTGTLQVTVNYRVIAVP
jgi:hypothetical protein